LRRPRFPYDFFLVRWSTSPVRESSAACVESSEVIPRPITRRPLEELEEPEALRALLEREDPEPLLALLPLPCDLPLLLEPRAPLLELPLPPLALIPPLLRFGMVIPRLNDEKYARTPRAARARENGWHVASRC